MDAMSVGLNGIGLWAGEPVSIDEAPCDDARDIIGLLKRDGFVSFRRSNRGVADMASAAIRDCLAARSVNASEIDTVIFSSESLCEPNPIDPRNAFLAALSDCGVVPTQVLGCWMNECANLPYALNLAHGLVASGTSRHVLVVASDKETGSSPRLMANGAAVMSDVAGCVLISKSSRELRLRYVVTHFASDVFAAERSGDVQRKTQAMMAALGRFANKIEAVIERSIGDYPLVLTDNLHSIYLDFICDGLGLPRDRTRQPSKADFAHGFSLDGLLGLKILAANGGLPRGEPIAILTVIPWSFGFTILDPPSALDVPL